MDLQINLKIREKDIDNNPIPVEEIKEDILKDISKQWNVSEYSFKVNGQCDEEKIEAFENEILYRCFIKQNPDTLICQIAKDYLTKENLKNYYRLLENV